MSDAPFSERDERDLLAAEYALGLLAGAERAEAARLARSDPEFARAVGRWSGRFAPLVDGIAEAAPPADLWPRIAARVLVEPRAAPSNVVRLNRRVTLWRAYAAVATALAASLAFLLVTRAPPPPPPRPAAPPPPMVATLGAEGSAARLVATWSPGSRDLVVAAAAGPAPEPGRGHELWLIPADGKPRPMGMMPRAGAMHMTLPAPIAAGLREGVTLAVSVEPEGGSPTGLPTGPVIAAGKLVQA